MEKKSPTSPSPLDPVAPEDPTEADEASAGALAKRRRGERTPEPKDPAAVEVKPFSPPSEDDEDAPEGWIEIELVDEAGAGVPGERYRVTLPNGRVASGTLNKDGFARIEGFEPGTCKICFPKLDQDAWEAEA